MESMRPITITQHFNWRLTEMNIVKKCISLGLPALLLLTLSACSPEIGSEQWCTDMKQKPKTDWTANEAVDFAKHCIFKTTEIGNKQWCTYMKQKPKADWTANEAVDFAKHCILK